jgi:hypothetical protein
MRSPLRGSIPSARLRPAAQPCSGNQPERVRTRTNCNQNCNHYRLPRRQPQAHREYLKQGDRQQSAAVWTAVVEIHATLALTAATAPRAPLKAALGPTSLAPSSRQATPSDQGSLDAPLTMVGTFFAWAGMKIVRLSSTVVRAPPLSPIGLTAADPFAGGEVSRAAWRVRSPGTLTYARRPAVTAALDAGPEVYHNQAAVWWGTLCTLPGRRGPSRSCLARPRSPWSTVSVT